ncbi:C3HC zinc finger-like-domain-containing protein [Ephemerocybe angulata]|uniref:C3HC zinc finger-like-domain-containing protein n=1 Tax=Ephemerocybe angulata TaxID=980116 RepID=A0A8H6HZA1_9AGAR|nr:C3HC zinc finger-like-domain-containing protein [Tulosesus angulatus]
MDQPTTTPSQNPTQTREDALRAKKRKLEDAFQTLDDAVQGPRTRPTLAGEPSAFKKTHLSRSIYTTLQKYGISKGSKSQSTPALFRSNTAPELSAKTPHLTAILSRVATKAKNAFTFKFNGDSPSVLPGSAEYRPSSLQSFLSRLETFKLSTYSNKPSSIDPVAAARCGWTNDGKDRLVCGFCGASWVLAGRDGMSREAANALIEKQRQGLVDNHKNGCPWKTRQCDASIYCVPLKTPTAMVKDLKSNARTLEPFVSDIAIRHPLTPSQLSSLKKTMLYEESTHPSEAPSKDRDTNAMDVDDPVAPTIQVKQHLSEAAILASLFGWSLVPPSTSATNRRVSASASISASRGPSRQPTRQGTPMISASAYRSISRPGTPTRQASVSQTEHEPTPLFKLPMHLFTKRENALLQCELCQRRVGLWAFTPLKPEESASPSVGGAANGSEGSTQPSSSPTRPKKPIPQRQFDLLKEHRSYCPYVVKSTILPTISTSSDPKTRLSRSSSSLSHRNVATASGPMEGWRAVLSVVLRFGMAQRHKTEYDVFGQNDANTGEASEQSQEADNVRDMVAGVKEHGGRELLKYVKGLLG